MTIFNSSFEANVGSGITIEEDGTLTINASKFLNNSESAVQGISHCEINVTDTRFIHNNATNGGSFFVSGSTVHTDYCLFTDNFAFTGGALYAVNSNVKVISSTFTRNKGINGGVVAMRGHLILMHCTMNDNTAYGDGGVGYIEENSTIIITKKYFSNKCSLWFWWCFLDKKWQCQCVQFLLCKKIGQSLKVES